MANYTMDDEARGIRTFAAQIAEAARTKADSSKLRLVSIAVLSSLQGTMAGNERQVAKATLLAVKRINDTSSYLQLLPHLFDGESTRDGFQRRTEEILALDKTLVSSSSSFIAAIFGCWTSASRKTVLGLLRRHASENPRRIIPLFYPVQFEGLEVDPHTVYGGATPNQQLRPVLRWRSFLLKQAGNGDSNHMKPFVVGSDYVYPRASALLVNELLDRFHKQPVKSHFIPFTVDALADSSVMRCINDEIIPAIREERPHFILNFVNGDANSLLFKALLAAGEELTQIPTISFSLTPADLHALSPDVMGSGQHFIATTYLHDTNAAKSDSFADLYSREWSGEETSDAMWNAYALVNIFAQAVETADSARAENVLNALRRNENKAAEFSTGNGDSFRLQAGTLMAVKTFQLGRLVGQDNIFRVVKANVTEIQEQDRQPLDPDPFLGIDSAHRQNWEHWVNILYLIGDVFPNLVELGLPSIERARDWLLDEKNQPFNPRLRMTWCEAMTGADRLETMRQLSDIGKLVNSGPHNLHEMSDSLLANKSMQGIAARIAAHLRDLRWRDGDLVRFASAPTSLDQYVLAAAKGKALSNRHLDRIYLFDLIDHCQNHHNHRVFLRSSNGQTQTLDTQGLLRLIDEALVWKNDARWNVSVFPSLGWVQSTSAEVGEKKGQISVEHYVVEIIEDSGDVSIGYGIIAIAPPMDEGPHDLGLSNSVLFQEFTGNNLRNFISALRVLFADLGHVLKVEKYGSGNFHFVGEAERQNNFDLEKWLHDRIHKYDQPGLWFFRWPEAKGRYNFAVAGWRHFKGAQRMTVARD
jgi:urea transport system substrate-binding protein